MSVVHFISDLHLVSAKPHLTKLFHHYMQNIAPKSNKLFILGDLFEVWLGDDAQDEMSQQIVTALLNYSQNHGQLHVGHGNRDFLLGKTFAEQTGATLIEEPHHFEFNGKKISLIHGDSLCTDDKPYQQLRAMVRDPNWQNEFLSQTIEQRIAFAKQVQAQSANDKSEKSAEIMDVNQQAVESFFNQWNCDILIHGHTHRPKEHTHPINGVDKTRIVLSDWDKQGHYLQLDKAQGFSAYDFSC